jgi:hypothetical protein
MDNPLLDLEDLPPFSRIRPEQVEPAIDQLLAASRQAIEVLLAANEAYSWDNLVRPLEDIEDRLNRRLFGIRIRPADGEALSGIRTCASSASRTPAAASPWRPFYLDPYSRPGSKRGGAWMDECLVRSLDASGQPVLPVAYLVCNQSPPVGDTPSLMTFEEVETLFHEFGHGLQHMLTTVERPQAAGINNVEWDAVELPSQFMENWCYDHATLMGMARHWQSGEPLPEAEFAKLQAARTFMGGAATLRQVHFALTDLRLHSQWTPDCGRTPEQLRREIAVTTTVLEPIEEDAFLCSFGHIFAGGYSAGYYSYKWAEVLSADAFSAFEEARPLLKRIAAEVDPKLEMTEICDRVLRAGGPALLFETPGATTFRCSATCSARRRAGGAGHGRGIGGGAARGRQAAGLPQGARAAQGAADAWRKLPIFKKVLDMAPKVVPAAVPGGGAGRRGGGPRPAAHPDLLAGATPGRSSPGAGGHQGTEQAAPEPRHLPPAGDRPQQGHHALALPPRRRAGFPRLAARPTPASPSRSRWRWAPIRRPSSARSPRCRTPCPNTPSPGCCAAPRTELVKCLGSDLQVPASAEFVLEGYLAPRREADEGPFGDHTGYYNEVDRFPVFTIERITHRRDPIYHSTYTGRPPDEPAMLGVALNEVFVPILQKQFPEIVDFYLPPEGCSYRMAVVSACASSTPATPSG